jgi:hypothetical protein
LLAQPMVYTIKSIQLSSLFSIEQEYMLMKLFFLPRGGKKPYI